MAFQNHGRNAGYQHKPNDAGPGQDVAKGKVAGNGSASNGDGKGVTQAGNGAAGRSDAITMGGDNLQSDRKPLDPDADEKLNNGSRLHRAHATHYDDAPEHDKALHKLEARARQLVKPSRQGSGHTSTSVQQSTDSGKLRVGAYREPNPGDADETNTGSVPQAQMVGDKSANDAGSKKAVANTGVARKAVGKVTVGKTTAGTKTVAKKAVGKNVVAKKAVAKKAVAKKAVAKKAVAKKAVAKKAVAKKAVAKKAVAKKAVAKKVVAKKVVAKKAVAKKAVAKKAVAKKVVAKKVVAKKVGTKRVGKAKG